MSSKLSIILCTFNEANYIKKTISELKNNFTNLELIIVDDNSTDGTLDIINEINKDNEIKLIVRKKAKGLASAFSRGVIETTGEYVGWLDTNMSELVPKFNEMLNVLKDKTDIVILSRYVEGGSDQRNSLRALSSKYFNIFCSIILRCNIKDFTSGIFLMKREVINETTFLGHGHGEFFIDFLYDAKRKDFKIVEIPFIQKGKKLFFMLF